MDIETLRELIAAFQQLGGEAKEAFIWYLVIEHLPGFILGVAWTVIGAFAVLKGIGLAREAIRDCSASGQLMKAAGVQVCWLPRTLDGACEVLRKARGK